MPPIYALDRIEGPHMHFFYSDSDWLATRIDVEQFLMRQLPEGIVQKAHRLVGFNHNDFLWGLRAPQEVYGPIVDEIWRSERHQVRRLSWDFH
jgi:lysosomal acid lipase/cholesteryl ester hydrolase